MSRTNLKKKTGPDLQSFFEFIDDISHQKGLKKQDVEEVVRNSFVIAYQRKFGIEADLEVLMDSEKPELLVIRRRKVVENVINPDAQLNLNDAIQFKKDAKIGDVLEESENPFEFSRVGATAVRHILHKQLQELERGLIYNEFKGKEGDLINGYFLRWRDREVVYVDLGRAEGILPRREQIPSEKFRPGDRVKAYIKSVELSRERYRDPGPFILLSRAVPEFVRKLFEMEIPEIYEGVVEVLHIVRQPGYRTKLMVRSSRQDIDPVGACVGIKGVRIQSIVRELGNERIDIVNSAQEPEALIANALSPAQIVEVHILNLEKEALAVVSDESYSLAIGNNGYNVRLACQLTGYNIAVKTKTQFSQEMSSPEARERLQKLFASEQKETKEEGNSTPLSEVSGFTQRIIGLLEGSEIRSVEDLVELSRDDIEKLDGVGKTTAKQIQKILSESIEVEIEET